MMKRQICFAVNLSILCVCLGCGDGNPDVYPVTGKLLYEGEPMPMGATVTFIPINDSTGVSTSGMVDAEGNIDITTFEDQTGLVPGEYRVIVYQIVEKEPDQVGEDGEIRPPVDADFTVVAPKDQIPEIYGDHMRSPLTITVNAEETDLGTIDLKANPDA
ncbi:MAG: hypothetical protein HUJ26_05985 [Planctomycetaceae bacterium]|nr:hypothetical protein [Planctomycetaceae bacterium]